MITSLHNQRIAAAVRLKKRAMRQSDRRFLVEGIQGVLEALTSGAQVHEVFHSELPAERLEPVASAANAAGVPVRSVSEDVMAHLTSTVTPQGVVAVVGFVDVPLESLGPEAGSVAILHQVRDPGNAGTILRSADAAGAGGVVFTRSSVDVYNSKAVRATAGSLFHVPVVREVDIGETVESFRRRGFTVLAASADAPSSVYDEDLRRPTAVILGNEAHGLPGDVEALADRAVRVPIVGRAESLNLAAAATLILFETARQQQGGGGLASIVAGAAHDIRSPLTAVRGFASTLVSKWDRLNDEQRLMMLEGVVHDGARMEIIVTQLVDAARAMSGHLELARLPVDLLAAVREVEEDMARWSLGELEVGGKPATVLADPARLRTMLIALAESAQWWGEEGPVRMEVRAGPPPTVRVWRQGTALGPEVIGELLRPRTPGTGGGSKVGLSVAKALADAHGGSLTLDGSEGIAFVLTLPPTGGAHARDASSQD